MVRRIVFVVAFVVGSGCLLASAEEGSLGFGFGGGGVAALFPDLGGVNTYLAANGLEPLGEFLIGGGGGGRGGVMGGMCFGGMGFGVTATSTGPDGSAELTVGAGGFDLGVAVGGDESSVLTLGAVLGGGASILEVSLPGVQPMGIVPEPSPRLAGRGFAMVLPYVSFEAQTMAFVGLEVRIGYLVPVVGLDFGDHVGIPGGSLDLSGPVVGVSVVFGGIGGDGAAEPEAQGAELSGTLELAGTARLALENRSGDVMISPYAVGSVQTGSKRMVEWSASVGGGRADSLQARVEAQSGPGGASLRTLDEGPVDYVLRVPSGTDLEIADGVGTIHVVGHTADSIRVSLGAGDLSVTDVSAGELSVSVGAGEIAIQARSVGAVDAHAGIGRVRMWLPPTASASITASVGIGEATVEGFPGMAVRETGFFFTKSIEAVTGSGTSACSLSVGIGEIEVRATEPPRT